MRTILTLLMTVSSPALAASDFTGTYTIASAQEPMTLRIEQSPTDTATGSITMGRHTCQLSGEVIVDDEDETSIEGVMQCPDSRGDFEFSYDDEDDTYLLLVTPYDDAGTPRLDLATLYVARRGAADSDPTPQDGVHDPRLIGVWSTQVMMSTPQGSMATQLLMEFRADGTLVDLGSRSMGSIPGVDMDTGMSGGGETAAWRSSGDILEVRTAASPWVQLARFEISGDRLQLVYYDGDRKLWHRQ